MKQGFVKTGDGAYIHYEMTGKGQPILFIHGIFGSKKFFEKNVASLKENFSVITIDLRGHGKSSKGLDGYSIDRLAQDVHEVIKQLKLKNVLLMGWSMGGPITLSYWKQFGAKKGRIAGLGLIDITPFPFSSGKWNTHNMRNYNAEAFNGFVSGILSDQRKFVENFDTLMFKEGKRPTNIEWAIEERMKLPPYQAIALYGSYVYSDYTDVLKTITVPTLVLAADSICYPQGIKQGKWLAKQIPDSTFVQFDEGGHMLFHIEADKFNKAVEKHAKSLQKKFRKRK